MTLLIEDLQTRLRDRRILLDVKQSAQSWLIAHGFDISYGARPLRRVIQKAIGNPLALLLLRGEVVDGSTVEISATDNKAEALSLLTKQVL